jgi:hypothetical protein
MNFAKVNRIRVIAALVSAALSTHAAERLVWPDGHGDLAVNFQERLAMDCREAGKQNVIIRLNDIGRTRSGSSGLSFLGAAGDPSGLFRQASQGSVSGHQRGGHNQRDIQNDRPIFFSAANGPGAFMMDDKRDWGPDLMNARWYHNADKTDVPAGGHFHKTGLHPRHLHLGYRASGLLVGQTTPIQ